MNELAERLKILRLISGLSIRQVAQRLERSPGTISNWETGKISPDVDSVEKLCKLYSISPNQLLGWEPCEMIEKYKANKKEKIEAMEALIAEKLKIEEQIKQYKKDLAIPFSNDGPDIYLDCFNPETNEIKRIMIEGMREKP